MLDGILSRALEIILVLDICGAVVYCLLSGITRSKGTTATTPVAAFAYGPGLQPCAASGPPPVPDWVRSRHSEVASVYAEPVPEPAPLPGASASPGFVAGLKRGFTSLRGRLSYAPAAGNRGVSTVDLGDEQDRLKRVLDSFREDA